MDIDHLDGSELFQSASGSKPRRQGMKAALQGDMQAIRQERDEDMSFYASLVLVEDRAYREVALLIINGLSEKVFTTAGWLRSGRWR